MLSEVGGAFPFIAQVLGFNTVIIIDIIMLLRMQSIPLFVYCSIIQELAVLYTRILTNLNRIQ